MPRAGAPPPLGGPWGAAAAAGGLGLPRVKLGEARSRGESCWLPPLPLVPLLKLLARLSVLSEAEVGSPLQGGEMGVSLAGGGGLPSAPSAHCHSPAPPLAEPWACQEMENSWGQGCHQGCP